MRSATDRRQPQKSDLRRSAILESLDHHLRESGFDGLNIADVTKRAGVTRSAFYFYFENKAAAVAALLEPMYDDGFVASDILTSTAEPAALAHPSDGGGAARHRRTPSVPAAGHARREGPQRGDPRGLG